METSEAQELETRDWGAGAQAFAYLGNALLKPARQIDSSALDAAFWRAFPDFGNTDVAAACEALAARIEQIDAESAAAGSDLVTEVSVEYTRLFVGPPSPAACPWETMYRGDGAEVGFGLPTFEMRELLRKAGLKLSNENNQYEDHIGIELLYLSVLCRRAAQGDVEPAEVEDYLSAHPLAWIKDLESAVLEAAPDGYYSCLLAVVDTLLKVFA